MDGGRIRHRIWRPCLWRPCLWGLGRLGSACLIAAGLSLFGVAVGTGQAANNNTLILTGTNGVWTVDAGPEPGSGSNILGGITTIDGRAWAAGIYDDGGGEMPLIEHR